jgi:hypothetical protein
LGVWALGTPWTEVCSPKPATQNTVGGALVLVFHPK